MTSKVEFWRKFINSNHDAIRVLKPGECIGPYDLLSLAAEYRVTISRAPELISINKISQLPKLLRNMYVYPIRLGQWHKNRAQFILCKAMDQSFQHESISITDLYRKSSLITGFVDEKESLILKRLSGEAIASSIGIWYVYQMLDSGKMKFVVPQYRFGKINFCFKIDKEYSYNGQVEVDTIVFSRSEGIVLESKVLPLNEKVLKFQLAFSMQAVSNIFDIKVRGYYAFKISGENKVLLIEMGRTTPSKCIGVNDLEPSTVLLIEY